MATSCSRLVSFEVSISPVKRFLESIQWGIFCAQNMRSCDTFSGQYSSMTEVRFWSNRVKNSPKGRMKPSGFSSLQAFLISSRAASEAPAADKITALAI